MLGVLLYLKGKSGLVKPGEIKSRQDNSKEIKSGRSSQDWSTQNRSSQDKSSQDSQSQDRSSQDISSQDSSYWQQVKCWYRFLQLYCFLVVEVMLVFRCLVVFVSSSLFFLFRWKSIGSIHNNILFLEPTITLYFMSLVGVGGKELLCHSQIKLCWSYGWFGISFGLWQHQKLYHNIQ